MRLSSGATLQNGKYRIVRTLGQGGFGITYLAENVLLDKKVAIKEFFPKEYCDRDATSHLTVGTRNNADIVARLRERFVKEARNLARLDHPGIVRIHDIFEENDTAYYVMDYIEGENLNEMVKREGPMPEPDAVGCIRKVGEAVEYMHSFRMTHLDIKPANIVVRKSDGQPVLLDFGLSKQYDAGGDATSTLMQGVSQGYSPIELYNAGEITTFTPQTDVYSLGATLYFLVFGKVPPSASQIIDGRQWLACDVSPGVQGAILKAMEPARGKRPATVAEFLRILKPVATDEETHLIEDGTAGSEPSAGGGGNSLKWSLLVPLVLIALSCVMLYKFCGGFSEATASDTAVVVETWQTVDDPYDVTDSVAIADSAFYAY